MVLLSISRTLTPKKLSYKNCGGTRGNVYTIKTRKAGTFFTYCTKCMNSFALSQFGEASCHVPMPAGRQDNLRINLCSLETFDRL